MLTEEGEFFLLKVKPLIIALKNSVAEIKDYHNKNSGVVTLGIPPMISLFCLHHYLNIFANYIQKWNFH